MAKLNGLANFPGNYNVEVAAPFDAREVVDYYADLTTPNIFGGFEYAGMTVYVKEKQKHYVLIDEVHPTETSSWSPISVEERNMEIVWMGLGDSVYEGTYVPDNTNPEEQEPEDPNQTT